MKFHPHHHQVREVSNRSMNRFHCHQVRCFPHHQFQHSLSSMRRLLKWFQFLIHQLRRRHRDHQHPHRHHPLLRNKHLQLQQEVPKSSLYQIPKCIELPMYRPLHMTHCQLKIGTHQCRLSQVHLLAEESRGLERFGESRVARRPTTFVRQLRSTLCA